MSLKIIIRYGEIALKGKNRRFFEEALLRNLKAAVKGCAVRISRIQGRFTAIGQDRDREKILASLSRVFGVVSLSVVKSVALDLESIKEAAVELVQSLPDDRRTFKVETRRPNKNFPLTSPEVNRLVGTLLLERFPLLKVDVHNPSFVIHLEISQKEVFLYHDSIAGPGGLPVGVTGKSLLLLSGGIDSPVAGWMAMKRGLSIEPLHFHSFPFTSQRSREKAIDLCRVLALYGGDMPLHMVSVTEMQKKLREHCPEALGIILLRRMMLRVAEEVCRQRGLKALVTGDSLGQVASQTLESLDVISSVTGLLVLRPLLTMDKHEIVTRAQAIETYEISIRPYEDCCTLFVPKHPVTRPTLERLAEAEEKLDIESLVRESLDSLETISLKG